MFENQGTHKNVIPPMFVNMAETAVFFEVKLRETVNINGSHAVSGRESDSNRSLTACVYVASDETKLFMFLLFKGKPGGRIEAHL